MRELSLPPPLVLLVLVDASQIQTMREATAENDPTVNERRFRGICGLRRCDLWTGCPLLSSDSIVRCRLAGFVVFVLFV